MILTLAALFLIAWIILMIANVTAGFIHILIALAVILFIWHFVAGRRHTV